MMKTRVLGLGGFLPKKVMYNSEFESLVDTSEDWIIKRTGILKRHIASDSETVRYMAYSSALDALRNSGLSPLDIDLILVATSTPDKTFPSCATMLQSDLGCHNAYGFDIQAACSGFLYGISVADSHIKSGIVSNILLIGVDKMSSLIDWSDRSTCILFGDGAGAIVMSSAKQGESGILSCHLFSNGDYGDILSTTGGVASTGDSGKVSMNGKVVFEYGIKNMCSAAFAALDNNGFTVSDIDYVIPHQANTRLINSLASRLGIERSKVLVTVDEHANTSAASIPLAWSANAEKVVPGSLVLLLSFGAGLTWGSVILKA